MKTVRLTAVSVAALAFACGPRHTTQFRSPPSALMPVTCVAVLPFENLTTDVAAGDAFSDLIATELVQSGRFQVMDRAESSRILSTRGIYLTATVDAGQARALGDVLGVQAVLLGSVDEYGYRASLRRDRPSKASIGATLRLVDVKTGDPLWGASYTGVPSGFFSDSTPPLHLAAQRAAMDLAGGLLDGAGSAQPPSKPCWSDRAQSVLATLAPGAQGPATAATVSTPLYVAVATPAQTPMTVVVSTPFPTPTPIPMPTAVVAVATPPPPAKPLTEAQNALLDKIKAGGQFVLDGVTFPGVTTKLAEAARVPLADLAAVLAAHPEIRLRVEAHVDPTDPAAVPLSQKRSELVVSRLIALGGSNTQVEAKGMGGSKTLFPSFVEAMKAKNRRVEIVVVAGPGSAPTVATDNPPAAEPARVKVLASKGASAQAVKLANTLKQSGTKITAVAAVPEERKTTLVYFSPNYKAEAEKLASSIAVPGGAKTSPANSLGAGVDIVILVGADLK